MVFFDNKLIKYESLDEVKHYINEIDLQIPEITVFKLIKGKLASMRMLDIGVGCGRTTIHFSDLVKGYIAIDYSIKMINACKNRFNGKHKANYLE